MSAIQNFVDELNTLIGKYSYIVSIDDLICELSGAIAMLEENEKDIESEK